MKPVEITVNGQKMLKCSFCDEKMTRRQKFKMMKHNRQVHKEFNCDGCDAKFVSHQGILREYSIIFIDILFILTIFD